MDREYLEDYEQREFCKVDEFRRGVLEGKFFFGKDRFPPDGRFVKIQKPVALTTYFADVNELWSQVPFSGSLILPLPPRTRTYFEETLFKISEIPKIVDFIKETGKLQIALADIPTSYKGLDHFDLFFTELEPSVLEILPISLFGEEKEKRNAEIIFLTLAKMKYIDFLREVSQTTDSRWFDYILTKHIAAYTFLKLSRYTLAEDIENLLVDDPPMAFTLLGISRTLIVEPLCDQRFDLRNLSLKEIAAGKVLPLVYRPKNIRFPCEIGKFLMKKLTYAPVGLDACKELMYNYDSYDLQKIQASLNEAIVANDPDIVTKKAQDLSEVLDNVWSDKTIPRKIKCLKFGVPLSMAAIGSVAAGPIGAAGGFLAGLGYSAVDKFIDLETEGLSERIAKLKTKSYQANVYGFMKKYKHRIMPT